MFIIIRLFLSLVVVHRFHLEDTTSFQQFLQFRSCKSTFNYHFNTHTHISTHITYSPSSTNKLSLLRCKRRTRAINPLAVSTDFGQSCAGLLSSMHVFVCCIRGGGLSHSLYYDSWIVPCNEDYRPTANPPLCSFTWELSGSVNEEMAALIDDAVTGVWGIITILLSSILSILSYPYCILMLTCLFFSFITLSR